MLCVSENKRFLEKIGGNVDPGIMATESIIKKRVFLSA